MPVRTDGPIFSGFKRILGEVQRKPLTDETQGCSADVVEQLLANQTSNDRPGMLLGRIQSGKTRAFVGAIAIAFDNGYDIAVVLTNLLRASKAIPYTDILNAVGRVRTRFEDKNLHVFGMGGTATLHLAALLNIDSVDSSGWRNRAARGLIQLPGTGDRIAANLGSWRGRTLSTNELKVLRKCPCPACRLKGVRGLRASGLAGFKNRATHNLHVLLEEARWLEARLANESYRRCFERRLDNSIYLPLIRQILESERRQDATAS